MTPHLHQHSHHCEHEHPELQSKYSQAFAKFNLHLHDEIVQEETKKIRTYFRTPLDAFTLYTLDTYPNEEGDRARIEIEFSNKENMKRYRIPQWLKELIK